MKYDSSLIIKMANDETANNMQQKITKRQNARHNPKKVVVVKKNNGKLEVIQLKSLTRFAPQMPEAAPQQFNNKTLVSFA
jgi:uncharacterized membrane protein